MRSADVEIDIDADAAAGQLVDEIIQPVEGLRLDCFAVSGIPQPARPAGCVHVMTPDAVNTRRGQTSRDVRSIGMCGHIRAKRQIDAPNANPL